MVPRMVEFKERDDGRMNMWQSACIVRYIGKWIDVCGRERRECAQSEGICGGERERKNELLPMLTLSNWPFNSKGPLGQ